MELERMIKDYVAREVQSFKLLYKIQFWSVEFSSCLLFFTIEYITFLFIISYLENISTYKYHCFFPKISFN